MAEKQNKKWYQKTLGIIFWLIFFYPAGLFLMWKHARWTLKTKGIITGIYVFFIFVGFAMMNQSTPSSTSVTHNSQEAKIKTEEKSEPSQEQKTEQAINTNEETVEKQEENNSETQTENVEIAEKNFDSNLGNTAEAAIFSQSLIDLVQLTIGDEFDFQAYTHVEYSSARLAVVMDNSIWSSYSESQKKDMVVMFINATSKEFPEHVAHVTISNGIRTVAEGDASVWGGDPKVKLN